MKIDYKVIPNISAELLKEKIGDELLYVVNMDNDLNIIDFSCNVIDGAKYIIVIVTEPLLYTEYSVYKIYGGLVFTDTKLVDFMLYDKSKNRIVKSGLKDGIVKQVHQIIKEV